MAEYGEDGGIPNNNNKYPIGVDGVGKPLEEGNNQRCPCTSMPCESVAKRALMLRASYSQWAALKVRYSQHALRASYSQRRPLRV
jgi:hypothetical protein